MIMRIPLALLLGGLLTLAMFWVLWKLISAPIDVTQMREATRIEFTRMRKDTEVASKREQKVERERAQASSETMSSALSVGGSLLGALLGGRRSSALRKAVSSALRC